MASETKICTGCGYVITSKYLSLNGEDWHSSCVLYVFYLFVFICFYLPFNLGSLSFVISVSVSVPCSELFSLSSIFYLFA